MANNDKKWTEWWWLGSFGLRTWSFEERKVRLELGMTALAVFLIIHFPLASLLELIEPHYGAVLSGIVSLGLGVFAARPIATIYFSDALRKADQNSQRRLRGRAARRARPIASISFPDGAQKVHKKTQRRHRGRTTRSVTPRFSSTVLTFVLAGPPIGLATLLVLFVPLVPLMLCLDTKVRQRAGDAVWEAASGHYRPFAGPFPLVAPQKAPT